MSESAATACLQRRFAAAGLDWLVPDWPAPPQVQAFSTTRNGEAGTPLDLSLRSPEHGVARAQLRRWLPADPVWLAQEHGRAVCDADAARAACVVRLPRADAAVARGADTVCAVLAADCMPVLFTDRAGSVVAAAHAGWRGLAGGVLEATLSALRVRASEVLVWLGPAIGPQAFEVGAEVLEAHRATDPGADTCFTSLRPGKWLADLYALARRRLARAGVGAVHGGGRCTFSESALFHSHRRDGAGAAGRMATLIWRGES
jgi:purine-nucleoside/S-methyl-5'-thioadenosine phosphorylase / adenosine deaminase